MLELQRHLLQQFCAWRPVPATVAARRRGDVMLSWKQEDFAFVKDQLLYRVQRRERIPQWVDVYSGGKTTEKIDNLAPCSPHKFRVRVILKASAVPFLAEKALQFYGNIKAVYENVKGRQFENVKAGVEKGDQFENVEDDVNKASKNEKDKSNILLGGNSIELGAGNQNKHDTKRVKRKIGNGRRYENEHGNDKEEAPGEKTEKGDGDNNLIKTKMNKEGPSLMALDGAGDNTNDTFNSEHLEESRKRLWLESLWSEETCTSTESNGTSVACFCMAVRGGYLKQVQILLEERPELINMLNPTNGFSPLGTAVRKDDLNMVRFLLSAGADIEQPSFTGQSPLHLAVLNGSRQLVQFLLEKGADLQTCDVNGMRVEHYAVDSGSVEMVRLVMDNGGRVDVVDGNEWTPLFRAGASTEMMVELISRGANVDAVDAAGLSLPAAARLLRNPLGRERESIMRLVDAYFPHEKAVANFTRLTKKISSLHTLFK